jgi:hypothetical protein
MKTLLTLICATLCAATGYGQTIKALSYNVSNSQVIWTNTNTAITFDNIEASTIGLGGGFAMDFGGGFILDSGATNFSFGGTWFVPIAFSSAQIAATTRTNLGLGATWLTNTSVTNFRSAIGLGTANSVEFQSLALGGQFSVSQDGLLDLISGFEIDTSANAISPGSGILYLFGSLAFDGTNAAANAATTRTNLALGATNIVTFAGLTNNGDININSTTASNGLLYIRRTNNEAFLGLANLIASNNTTISNETLFRVGTAEATNRSAQFGFRSTNTNGSGVAVFSVFGFNALMMVGADASTNAVIYSGGGTNNEVMTLIRDGATEFARPIRFSTNASTRPATNEPATNNHVAAWVEMRIGTNSYRVPLYK